KPELPVEPVGATYYQHMLENGHSEYYKRAAIRVLKSINSGQPREWFHYYVQVWQLAPGIHIVALKGEVSTEYSLLLKQRFMQEKLLVLGYSNGVLTYIPSRKMIAEGGYGVNHPFTIG